MSPLISCLAGTSHVIKRTRNVLPIQPVVHFEVDSTIQRPSKNFIEFTIQDLSPFLVLTVAARSFSLSSFFVSDFISFD